MTVLPISPSPLLLGTQFEVVYPVERSLRFRSDNSAYLSRTVAIAGNRRTWTWSAWVKRGTLGVNQYLFAAGTGGTDATQNGLYFHTSNQLRFTGISTLFRATTNVYRDASAWYHIVVQFDTTQATATNRLRIYVNGLQVTSFATNNALTLNGNYAVNQTGAFYMGRWTGGTAAYFDGYMADINFVDGLSLDPTSFGYVDQATNVWMPRQYTGAYGSNGFYLKFTNNSATTATTLGKDYSGNNNNWTPNGFSVTAGTTYDSMYDSPTNYNGGNGRGNYCTLNPVQNSLTLNDGNLNAVATSTTTAYDSVGTFSLPTTGKWYWEAKLTSVGLSYQGVVKLGYNLSNATWGAGSLRTIAPTTGNKFDGSTSTAYGSAYANGDTLQIAYDADAGKIWFGKNGLWQASGNPASGANAAFSDLSGNEWKPIISQAVGASLLNHYMNYGQAPFTYTPPTGFNAVNTYYSARPTIRNSAQYFDATTYVGTGATQSVANSGNMQPDFVWIKSRTQTTNHGLMDSQRTSGGVPYNLFSNLNSAENLGASYLTSTPFLTNGFQLNTNTSGNALSQSYIAWQWKEASRAGFDIVLYTGNGANRTIAHNLGNVPKMMIVKDRTAANDWAVYHVANTNAPATQYLLLNSTAVTATDSTYWNNTAPTSSVFSVGTNVDVNANGDAYVAYLWAQIANFSRFGSYVGNGNADGPYVSCGFRPSFVLIRRTNVAANWVLMDDQRDGYNVNNDQLYPNLSNVEATTDLIDIVSDGFKIRSTDASVNASGGTYIYAAFAENPFKYARAR